MLTLNSYAARQGFTAAIHKPTEESDTPRHAIEITLGSDEPIRFRFWYNTNPDEKSETNITDMTATIRTLLDMLTTDIRARLAYRMPTR